MSEAFTSSEQRTQSRRFLSVLASDLKSASECRYEDNWDNWRFPPVGTLRRTAATLKTRIRRFAREGLSHSQQPDGHQMGRLLTDTEAFEACYLLLDDEGSRELLVSLAAYRMLGWRHVKLPTNTSEHWRLRRRVGDFLVTRDTRRGSGPIAGPLNLYDLSPMGKPVRFHGHPLDVLNTFLLEQYRYGGIRPIEASPGDIVLDAGACWGDTALYFAEKVAPSGRVVAVEFLPENLEILRANLELNGSLGPLVTIVERALWESTGDTLSYRSRGPATVLRPVMDDRYGVSRPEAPAGEASGTATTVSIDQLVADLDLDRVDFIKMDIEGAEQYALLGAQETIRQFVPKLAISLYHSVNDFKAIPAFLEDLQLGYKFHLGHYTIHAEETILFAERP